MAMTAELRANPQEILGKSGEMKSVRTRLSSIMQDMKGRFQALNSSWESEASAAFQAQFTKIHKDIEEMLNIVDEYTRDLDEVAQTYISTERKLEDIATSLPGDVFG
jgi:WXG100 family type VII secretion target